MNSKFLWLPLTMLLIVDLTLNFITKFRFPSNAAKPKVIRRFAGWLEHLITVLKIHGSRDIRKSFTMPSTWPPSTKWIRDVELDVNCAWVGHESGHPAMQCGCWRRFLSSKVLWSRVWRWIDKAQIIWVIMTWKLCIPVDCNCNVSDEDHARNFVVQIFIFRKRGLVSNSSPVARKDKNVQGFIPRHVRRTDPAWRNYLPLFSKVLKFARLKSHPLWRVSDEKIFRNANMLSRF